MLYRLLRSVKRWVFDLLFNNDLADKEVRLYFGDKNESD